MKKKLLLIVTFITLFSIKSLAQPSNDLCSGAIDLPVGLTCTNTIVTIDGTATDSGLGDPGCAGYAGGDLWYKVTVPSTGSLSITTDTGDGGILDGGMSIYTGLDCNNLVLYECNDSGNTASVNDFELINLYGRTPGEVIYVRVWVYNNDSIGTFNICAVTIPQLDNDTCVEADVLTVGATCSNTLVVLDGTATDSGVEDPDCGNYAGGDLWYEVTMPASGVVSIEASTSDGSITNIGMAVYVGADCNSLIKLSCATNGSGGFPKAVVSQGSGEVIYVRVWENGNDAIGAFNLCAIEVVSAQPSNDLCSGAIDLPVGLTCTNTIVTIDGTATDSGLGDPGCAGYAGGDLWYKVTVPSTGSLSITTDTGDGGILDGGMSIYTGLDCNNLVLYECNDSGNTASVNDFELINLYGRTPGEVIYVRVWVYNNDSIGTFNICAVTIPQLDNDTCVEADVLTVGATCSNTLVVLDGTATDSGVEDPDCGNYAGGDLWYEVTMPASGVVSIEASTSDGSITNIGMAVYVGADCNSLIKLSCATNGSGGFPKAVVSQGSGEVIYVRVWENGNDAIGAFNLCAIEVVSAQPSNDLCSGAIDLPVGLTCTNTIVTIDGTATDSGLGDPGCAGYAGGDLWYKVTVPSTGSLSITTDTGDGGILDGGMSIYTGLDCNNLVLYECNDSGNTASVNDFELINLYGRTPGEVIYVRVWVYNNDSIGTFNLCAVQLEPLGIKSNIDDAFKIYPNPAKGQVYISLKTGNRFKGDIRVFDLNGKLMIENNDFDGQLNISKLSKGLYIMSLRVNENTVSKKLIIQ